MTEKQNIRVAVDAIVFGYQNNQLYLLLIQQKFGTQESYWALPGGLVKNDESLQVSHSIEEAEHKLEKRIDETKNSRKKGQNKNFCK